MTMKTKNIILSLFFGASLFTACTDGFDAINKNPNGMFEDEYFFAKSDLGIAIRNAANFNYTKGAALQGGADIHQRMKALGIDAFVQYGTGSGTSASYTQNDEWQTKSWDGFYGSHLWPLNYVIYGAEKNPGYDNYKAIALIWRVFIQARITDYFGPAPFPRSPEDSAPEYMPLEQQYTKFFEDLDAAMAAFDDTQETATSEPLYEGNLNQWRRFGNTLRLRLALTLSEVAPETCKTQAQAAASHPAGVMKSGDNAAIAPYTDWGNQYPYYMYIQGWGERNYLLTTTMEKVLTGIGGIAYNGDATNHPANVDPRGSRLFDPSPTGSNWKGRKPGLNPVPENLTPTISGMSKAYVVPTDQRHAQLETYVEACFLMAEAVERFGISSGKTAKEWYEEGVKASFTEWGVAADATAYLSSNVKNGWGTSANYDDVSGAGNTRLEKIITQKYIGCYPDLSNQVWNDKRRLNLPAMDIPEFRDSGAGTFPSDNNIQNPRNFIQRTVYPQSEVSLNREKYEAAVAAMGGDGDKVSTPLWWATGANYCSSAN